MYVHITTLILLTITAFASPKPQTLETDVYDDLPWKLTTIVIIESLKNSSNPTLIQFDVEDPNPGLETNTTCALVVPGGTDLASSAYFPCNDNSMGFSYRGNEIWIRHSWMRNDASGVTSCIGRAATSFEEYPLDAGVMKKQEEMEVLCTMQSG